MNATLAQALDELVLPPSLLGETVPTGTEDAPGCLTPDGVPIQGSCIEQWQVAELYLMDPDNVLRDEVGNGHVVSTVYLGLNHGWHGVPLIWETMIFPGGDYQWRYATRAAAMSGHHRVLAIMRAGSNL